MQEHRFYRDWVKEGDLLNFEVKEKETDLLILADKNLEEEAKASLIKHRKVLEGYIEKHPEFKDSLEPLEEDISAPAIVRGMMKASRLIGVGPMAGVAGAVAEYVGGDLLKFSKEIIVENGGDIFFKLAKERVLAIYAGESRFTKKIGLKIKPKDTPLGICASSGKIGHSLSFGKADAAIVIAKDTIVSDCAATKIGNLLKTADDIKEAMAFAKSVAEVLGVVIIIGEKLATWGQVELVKT